MSDTDGLAAETRRLLDAATPGVHERCIDTLGSRPSWMGVDQYDPCRCKLPNGHDGDHLCSHDAAEPNNHPGVKRTVDNRDADAALIAAAPRLLANWLAREDRPTREAEWVRAVQYGAKVVKQRDAAIAERDRLADENRALREAILDAVTELGLAHEPDWASDKAKADGKDPVWCRICGPADGSWPCTSQMVVTDLLAAADRGVTDGDRNEGDEE